MTATVQELVRELREGDQEVRVMVAGALGTLAGANNARRVEIAAAGGIPALVELLRDGSAGAKWDATRALLNLAINNANKVLIAEAGGVPPLVQLLRNGSVSIWGRLEAKTEATWVLGRLARHAANRLLIAEAGGIPPLVQLLRDGGTNAMAAASTLRNLACNNDANAVAIALTVGFDAVIELARRGRVTVDDRSVVHNAALPAKRKAALVVAALLRDFVPKSVPREIKGLIGPCL